MAFCTHLNKEDIGRHVQLCLDLLHQYQWFVDSYVLDFFVDDHWKRIPKTWQHWLKVSDAKDLAQWLDVGRPLKTSYPVPLSLLALRKAQEVLSLGRNPLENPAPIAEFLDLKPSDPTSNSWNTFQDEFSAKNQTGKTLLHVFRKHIKPKKQHEISRMAQVSDIVSRKCHDEKNVIDIGSGMGHLARLLSYTHKFNVSCVDIETDFTASAIKFDQDLRKSLEKRQNSHDQDSPKFRGPSHVTFRLDPEMDITELEEKLASKFNHEDTSFTYGIVGLHTCGDLGPLLIKLFVESPGCVFVQSVGCCYMKLNHCYPLSTFLANQPWHQFSYVNQELSCHALEMYIAKLQEEAHTKLKTHCYRANLELMISKKCPKARKSALKTVSRAHELEFETYVNRATAGMPFQFGLEDFQEVQGFELDNQITSNPEKKKQLTHDYLNDINIVFASGFELPAMDPSWTWFNVEEPLTFDHFKYRIVILDFFTYCCINCMHILPDLEKLEGIFGTDQVLIIGVHSAKFENEKIDGNIQNAIKRYGIHHPVVNDRQAKWWNQLQISCWPTLMILSPALRPLKMFMGEGHLDKVRYFVEEAMHFFNMSDSSTPPKRLPPPSCLGQVVSSTFLKYPGKISLWKDKILISDSGHHRLVVINRSGLVEQVIGSGVKGFQDGHLTSAQFSSPQGGIFIKNHLIIVADTENHSLRQIDLASKTVTTLAGNGQQGRDLSGGKNGPGQLLASPWDLCLGSSPKALETGELDTLFVAMAGTHQIWGLSLEDSSWWKGVSRKQGDIFAVAGSGVEENRNTSYPNKAGFAQPSGITFSSKLQSLYVADSESSSIRSLCLKTGTVKNVCGGSRDPTDLFAFGDKDGSSVDVRLQHPLGLVMNQSQDTLFVADSYNHKVKAVTHVTGKKAECQTIADISGLDEPAGMAFDPDTQELLIADTNHHTLKVYNVNTKVIRDITVHTSDETDFTTSVPVLKLRGNYDFKLQKDILFRTTEATIAIKITTILDSALKLNQDAPSHWKLVLPEGWHCASGLKGSFQADPLPVDLIVSPQSRPGPIYVEVNAYLCHKSDGLCLSKSALIELNAEQCDNPAMHTKSLALAIHL
ncbi:hypothetical protein TCAL_04398 [Tigriopus californicus]|uniref:Thioredoxin domain-containing protein n=1 Tax=Tigriopus californicus TaxID=6832 RepID=A0A553N8J0_TIGCA|nr:hypothetical protein TCAL_04398 [Tigriopus californicus]